MSGMTHLPELIRAMQPVLHAGNYVFCTVEAHQLPPLNDIVALVREREGITVIVPEQTARQHGLPYQYVAAWITLEVHSSLAAVGLTAAFSAALAKAGISCNVVAGYYHDHLFVAAEDAEKAMLVLEALAEQGES